MGTYILRRILLMIPTFFAISLIVFLILNLAPGKPGELASVQGQEQASESSSKREAYRIFKEQFNLDKPILLNFRYALSTEEIYNYIKVIVEGKKYLRTLQQKRYQKAEERLKERPKYTGKDIIEAEDILEDYGQYAVPHLVKIILNTQDPDIKREAVLKFSQNARGRVFNRYRDIEGIQAYELKEEFDKKYPNFEEKKGEEEYKLAVLTYINKKVNEENMKIKRLWYRKEDPPQKKEKIVKEIKEWYEKHKHWYEYSLLRKIKITFLDTRFAKYWNNLLHFDFGISHVDRRPVINKVLSKIKYSITLSFTALLLSYFIAVPLGIFSAIKQNTLADRIITLILFMLYSLPTFFVGTLLLKLFSIGGDYFHIFPTGGFQSIDYMKLTTWEQFKDILWHIFLPIVCLTYTGLASLSRYARTGLLDVIRSDYIKTARAKGLPEYIVILKHAVRNGMIPILTLLASLLPVLIGGSVVIEFIFAIDGMGLLTLSAITARDYNTIMCVTLLSAILVMLGILLSDISYALIDPRISFK